MKNTTFLLLATPLCLIAPAYAQKSPATPYLQQAKTLLPSIGIELEPGDGGEVASEGKLLYSNLLPLYVKLALVQKQMGNTPGAQATLARAMALCTRNKDTYQSLVTLVVNEGLHAGFYTESVAFHKKNDIDGFRAPLLAQYEMSVRNDPKAATAVLLAGIERGKILETRGKALEKDSDDQWTRQTTLFKSLDCAVRYNLLEAASSARAALAPYVKDLSGIDLCRAVFLEVPGAILADAETKLRAENEDNPVALALGLSYLKKDAESSDALKKLGKNADLPPAFVFFLKPPLFARLASEDAVRRALGFLRQEGRETPETVRILETRLLENSTLSPAQRAAKARKEFLYIVRSDQKRAVEKGSYEYSARQSQYAYMLVDLIPLDPAFAGGQLSRIVEPRYRFVLLTELAAHFVKK